MPMPADDSDGLLGRLRRALRSYYRNWRHRRSVHRFDVGNLQLIRFRRGGLLRVGRRRRFHVRDVSARKRRRSNPYRNQHYEAG